MDFRVLLGQSTSTRRATHGKHWKKLPCFSGCTPHDTKKSDTRILHTCGGKYPQTSLPNLNLHVPIPNCRNPWVCFRLLRMKSLWKNWESNQPPFAPQQVSLTQPWRCAVWTDEISSSRFRFDSFRDGNGKKQSWNMLLVLPNSH